MNPIYITAFAALTGSIIGGLTSLGASWLSQRVQFRVQRFAQDLNKREELYKHFIEEATRLYVDAFQHDNPEISNLVNLYALVSRMRILSAPNIVNTAEKVVGIIIETYIGPNRTFHDIAQTLDRIAMLDPLREFSNACREELHELLFP
jgi:hypothetical protein